MMINNLGSFESIEDVWKAYPYGGKEGDYVEVAGEPLAWNKYTNNWGEEQSQEQDVAASQTFRGDVFVGKNLYVGDTLTAKKVRTPDKGLFATEEALKRAVPKPEVGFWAAVGDSFPAELWVCNTEGEWQNAGEQYYGGEVILDNYTRKDDIAENLLVEVESEDALKALLESGNYDPTKLYYTNEEDDSI